MLDQRKSSRPTGRATGGGLDRRAPAPPPPAAVRLQLLESVVVNANDAVLITDADPDSPLIVSCNAAFTRMTGYAEAEVLGRTPHFMQAPGISRPALERVRAALRRGEPAQAELLNVRKDGTEFWVELSIVPVTDGAGRCTHHVSVQRDATHRRHAEAMAASGLAAKRENVALRAEVAQLRLVEGQLRHAAFHDGLTGLRNRAFLMGRLADALPRPGRCAVLFMDLDRFKLINDSLGHRVGDLLLMEAAQRLQGCIRPGDILARIGGDEFAVLVEGGLEAAVATAEGICAAMAQPFRLGGHDVFSLCSVGVAQVSPGHAKAEELLRDADMAMYAAKKRGAGGYAVFCPSMHGDALKALAMQTDLRHAVARCEFELHYQPILSLETLRPTGLEALVRWRHPVRGLVAASEFIPIAEEIGVMRDVGRWVLREACTQMRQWQGRYPGTPLRVGVNVSGAELRDPSFVPELRAVLDSTGMDPERLQLEVTESVFLHRPELAGQALALVRAMGVRVALDDFGAGCSSLAYLARYELDAIKIDCSFAARMLHEGRAFPIVDAIVRLGATLRLVTVAEGVETEAQLAMLRSMSCQEVQGNLLGRPAPAAELAGLLARA